MKQLEETLRRNNFSELQIKKIMEIATKAETKYNEVVIKPRDEKRENWEDILELVLLSHVTIMDMLDFAIVDKRFLISNAICKPILEDTMNWVVQFLIAAMSETQKEKEIEELKRMVGE